MPLTNGSTPIKPVAGRLGRAMQQMFAAAEADFEPNSRNIRFEQAAQIGRRFSRQVEPIGR